MSGEPTIAQRIANAALAYWGDVEVLHYTEAEEARVISAALGLDPGAVGEVVVVTPELQALMDAAKAYGAMRADNSFHAGTSWRLDKAIDAWRAAGGS